MNKNQITELPNDLVYMRDIQSKSRYAQMYYYFKKGLTRHETNKGIAFSLTELEQVKQPKFNDSIPKDVVGIKELEQTDQFRVRSLMNKKLINKYKVGKEVYFSPNEIKNMKVINTRPTKKREYKIDLSTNARINCLYKRLTGMNTKNKQACQKDNRLTRYVDECNFTCINIKDYIKPQIKLIAQKLECKENLVFAKLYELIEDIYKQRKGE